MRVLLVEDHADVAETIGDYMTARGHHVETAGDGLRGLELAVARDYDAIILDRLLPGMDGATMCSRLRNEAGRNTPVLMLTALTTTGDKLAGFAAGADDYLSKPFDLAELEARLMALHRRSAGVLTGHRLQVEDLVYEPATLTAYRAGQPLYLSPTARRILEFLMRRTHRVVTHAELEEHLWGKAAENDELLRVHIHSLRAALDEGRRRKLLHTVRGVGYRLAVFDAD
jgi:DNA-binding response OmpR family regulator